jgi:RecB family exonuclease
MSWRAVWSPFGAPAHDALRERIEQAKEGDPLRPVTVIVPTGSVGLGARRSLAERGQRTGGGGVTNVTFLTLEGLSETLAADHVVAAGRSPMTDTVLRGAVKVVLGASSWPCLGGAGEHPSTIEAIITTYRELRGLDAKSRAALAASGRRAAEMLRLLGAVRQRVAPWYDAIDLHEAAIELIETGAIDPRRRLGAVIAFLPAGTGPAAMGLLRALSRVVPGAVVVGWTGEPTVDATSRSVIEGLCPGAGAAPPTTSAVRVEPVVLSAPTVDAELLLVLREVMAHCAAGIPLERMAIAHSGTGPYPTLVPALLRQVGIPTNGGVTRPLSSTMAGRVLLGALTLPEQGWRRDDVVDWLCTGPLRHRGRPVPATRWDLVSAAAGIIEGKAAWSQGLAAYAAALGADGAERHQREVAACESLSSFIDELALQLSSCPTSWTRWAEWAARLLRSLVGGTAAMERWPADELVAAEAVQAVLAQLPALDALGLTWSAAAARSTVEAELAGPAPQTTRFGAGIWVAPIGAACGLTFDALFVVGLNDGSFPPHPADDVLLPDRERTMVDGDAIPLRADRVVAMRRHFLAALAGASAVHLSYRRGSVRDGRALRPSRWALDAIAAATGHDGRLYLSQLDDLAATARFRVEPSWLSSVAAEGEPIDVADRDLRTLAAWTGAGGRLAEHPLCAPGSALGRGADLVAGRGDGFSRYEGDLSSLTEGSSLVPAVLSASGLERFAQCPRRYFFESVLGVTPRPVSEHRVAADGGALGSLIHRILEQFAQPQIGRTPGTGPDDPFATERLLDIAARELADFEAAGLAGPATAWTVERTRLLRALRRYAEVDRQWRQGEGIVTTGVEQPFGHDGEATVEITVPAGQTVAFRGTIDRVDRRRDGRVVVTDYKTGRADHFRQVEFDHLAGGRSVQLPLYAAAVGAATGEPVEAAYWCVSEREQFARYGFTVDGSEVAALGQVVGVLTDAMGSGQFPANPGEEDTPSSACSFCPYRQVCPQDRFRAWQQVQRDEALSAYVEVAA